MEQQLKVWPFLDKPNDVAESVRSRYAAKLLPVPVVAIAEALGAQLAFTSLTTEGVLIRSEEGYTLKVNKDSAEARRRYTIAHEIGHIMCDSLSGTAAGTRFRANNIAIEMQEEERFCQRFAACLLIPESTIDEFATWDRISIQKLREKARSLQVSAHALLWRVIERLPYEGGAMCFRTMGKPNAPEDIKLRLDWSVFPNTAKFYSPRYATVPTSSPIYRAQSKPHEMFSLGAEFNFGRIRGKRNLLIHGNRHTVLAIVLPPEIDPATLQGAFQTVGEGI